MQVAGPSGLGFGSLHGWAHFRSSCVISEIDVSGVGRRQCIPAVSGVETVDVHRCIDVHRWVDAQRRVDVHPSYIFPQFGELTRTASLALLSAGETLDVHHHARLAP